MVYENILSETKNGTQYITINRATKLNALNKQTLEELHHAFVESIADVNVKSILLTGDGEKAFVAGADIAEFANFSIEEGKELSAIGQESVFNLIENSPVPVIAAINGFALGNRVLLH